MKYKLKTYSKKLLADTITPVNIYLKLRDVYAGSILLESSDIMAMKIVCLLYVVIRSPHFRLATTLQSRTFLMDSLKVKRFQKLDR